MTFKDFKELKSMNEKELGKEIKAASKFLNALHFEHSQRNMKDTSQLRKIRVYVARCHTITNSRKKEEVKS